MAEGNVTYHSWLTFYVILLITSSCMTTSERSSTSKIPDPYTTYSPALRVGTAEHDSIGEAWHISVGDIMCNLRLHAGGLQQDSVPALFAGTDYYGPWSRDGSINVSNWAALVAPGACRALLNSSLTQDAKGRLVFAGEYWDNLLLTRAHYDYYLVTEDTSLLHEAYLATINTLADREVMEFDSVTGLFRGAAGFNDGISGYPDLYANTGTYAGGQWVSNIKKWVEEPSNASIKAQKGFGLPLMPLSTNCVYYQAYATLPLLAKAGKKPVSPGWQQKAQALKAAINKELWLEQEGWYAYFKDHTGLSKHQEAMGMAYAILFGVANDDQAKRMMRTKVQTPAGIPCLWPGFSRYDAYKQPANTDPTLGRWTKHYPRHAQTVWGMNMGLWAHAAAKVQDSASFVFQFQQMRRKANRDRQFRELYHPDNGLPYGGVQENNDGKLELWKSMEHQVWVATGYQRALLQGMLGMELQPDTLVLKPFLILPENQMRRLHLSGLRIQGHQFDINVVGRGKQVKQCIVNGEMVEVMNHKIVLPLTSFITKNPSTIRIELTMH